MQVVVSEPVTPPDWSDQRLSEARAGDRYLLAASAVPVTVDGAALSGEYAIRSVVFVSSDPASEIDTLVDAVASTAGSFDIR